MMVQLKISQMKEVITFILIDKTQKNTEMCEID